MSSGHNNFADNQTMPAGAGQELMTDEVNWQLSRLKTDSDELLKQLMLEQQTKLQQMVQQLQPQVGAPGLSAGPAEPQLVALTQDQDLTAKKAPLAEVLRLQQQNMGHLDLLIERINASMQASLRKAEPD